MTRQTAIRLVYMAGLMQGLALVTFPATSPIFTSQQGYGLTSTQYGAMFLPQVVLAILAASLAPALARRWQLKRVFLLGLSSNLLSMALLTCSVLFISSQLAYGILLFATAALGLGFGTTVMATNTFVEEFSPGRADSAVLVLNALLGTGTALAPLFVAIFLGLGVWWLLPILIGIVLLVLLLLSVQAPLQVPSDQNATDTTASAGFLRGLPARFWLYAAVVLLYGIAETLNGNWSMLYLTQQRGVPTQWASLALTAFWAMVTIGRVLAAFISSRISARWLYPVLPALLVIAFLIIAQVDTAFSGIMAFSVAGLACSAFLPLSISFGGKEFFRLTTVVSGEIIAFYQVGYGIAAFGVGPLQNMLGIPLSMIYAYASLVAGAMIVLTLFVIRSPTTQPAQAHA